MQRKILKIITFCFTFYFLHFTFYIPVKAVCPVCTVAVGGGLLLSHYFGIDDLVVGIWIGGLIISLGLWMASSLKKTYFKAQQWLITAVLWASTVWSLKLAGFIGQPTCMIHGHDKLLSGIIFGSIAFLLGYSIDFGLRKLNKKDKGKAFFPYQKVILPLFFLILATILSWQLCQFGIK